MILRRWSTSLLETGQNLWGAREGPSTGERRLFFEKNFGGLRLFLLQNLKIHDFLIYHHAFTVFTSYSKKSTG